MLRGAGDDDKIGLGLGWRSYSRINLCGGPWQSARVQRGKVMLITMKIVRSPNMSRARDEIRPLSSWGRRLESKWLCQGTLDADILASSSSTSGKTMWEGLSDAAGSSFSSAWLTGKTLERSLRLFPPPLIYTTAKSHPSWLALIESIYRPSSRAEGCSIPRDNSGYGDAGPLKAGSPRA